MIILRSVAIGGSIDLKPLTGGTAELLGGALAAIEPWSRYPHSQKALTSYLSASEADAPRFAIRVDGVTAGAIGVRHYWLRGPYLQFLGILPDYQRRGVGSLMLEWFESSARTSGERNLWVAASDFNEKAIVFYERHGFVRTAVLDDLVSDGISEVLLRKRLCAKK